MLARLFVFLICLGCFDAHAASVELLPSANGVPPLISISGDIVRGDEEKFDRIALQIENAEVLLVSPGGDVYAGLAIAKAVKLRGYSTAVPQNSYCTSICAVIWISGKKKFASYTSQIGFHAAYRVSDGSESGAATTEVGIHLFQLGLSPSLIRWLVSAGPKEMHWLTPAVTKEVELNVTYFSEQDRYIQPQQTAPIPNQTTVQFDRHKGLAIAGFDIAGAAHKSNGAESCLQACQGKANCVAFTYDAKEKICYPKSGGRVLFANRESFSGNSSSMSKTLFRSKIELKKDVDVVGADMRSTNAPVLENCIFDCVSDPNCKAFTFSKKFKKCWLKSSGLQTKKDSNLFSGIK